jgi:hypothetical protein
MVRAALALLECQEYPIFGITNTARTADLARPGMGRSIEHGVDRSVSVIHSRHPGGSSLQKAQARRPDRRWNSLALGQRMVD